MLNQFVASNLQNVNAVTNFDDLDVDRAYELAETFTELGFEVTVPKSYDGVTYSIRVMQ